MFKIKLLVLSVLLITVTNPSWAGKRKSPKQQSIPCVSLLKGISQTVTLIPAANQIAVKAEDLSVLRVLSYNMENFFIKLARYQLNERFERIPIEGQGPQLKEPWKTDYIAKIIGQEIKPDIAGLQEIEKESALDQFSHEKLNNEYEGVVIKGNDTRGIQVGTLTNKKLPFTLEIRSYAETKLPSGEKVFSRDAPVTIYKVKGKSKPFLILINVHSKSKQDRANDPMSNKLRTAQHEAVAQIITQDIWREFGKDAPIIILGDTNTEVVSAPELNAIRALGFKDALDVKGVPLKQRVTHTYHPGNEPVHQSQIDAIFLSPSLQKLLVHAEVYRYHDANGKILPIPTTPAQRDMQPSDHFPYFVDIDFSSLIK